MLALDTFIDDIDYSDIEAKYQVHWEEDETTLVIDHVPIIEQSKHAALVAKMAKAFARKGAMIKPEDIYVPWDDSTGKSKGYVFIDFSTGSEAAFALEAMQGYAFDAKHIFAVNFFSDIEHYSNLDEYYLEPSVEEYVPKEHLRYWLSDPQGRDQYVTYSGDQVVIHWHGKPGQYEVAHAKPENNKWTELFLSWSPLGTYLATVHRQGIRLWGGRSFKMLEKFAHPLVVLFDFSPCERYLVTWSHVPIVVPEGAQQGPRYFSSEDEGNQLAVWEIASGHLLRTFPTDTHGGNDVPGNKAEMHWPALKWSPDGKYVARAVPGQQISVYELPGMGLQGKKSIKIEGVVEFEWRPLANHGEASEMNGNMLAYWTPEVVNQPARVTLLAFPSRTVVRQKNLFNVSECKLFWQNQGDFLCVKVDRHTKTKKTLFSNLEIFHVREKDCPVEVIELKDVVLDFSWEPKGERFGVVSSNDPNLGNSGATVKTDIGFYQLHKAKEEFRLLCTLPEQTSNVIRWSPQGRFVVLATVGSPSKSELQFWDLDFKVDDLARKEARKDEWGAGLQRLGTADHYGVTDLEWDPSGRYLASSASAWKHTLENGYAIWDFRGQEVTKHLQDGFKQFIWRPRPPTILSKEQRRIIRKNLREYSRQFDEEDAAQDSTASAELVARYRRLVDEWNTWRAGCNADTSVTQHVTKKSEVEECKEEVEIWVEELIDEREEVLE
ncbi:Eukaryotic translation initiation factor 3 subunit B [Hypsizygus marmoreus]|uniref:Eukaryotic translation initiation factor 3 subunit B n=1 Tax=Hypsizygus marmoreus TaxID=39966 RepID=A0A369JN83_HYPMA|nr:Eukaryotic translation initiation factor 3 subunit B [Hypsizygus marmoreus]